MVTAFVHQTERNTEEATLQHELLSKEVERFVCLAEILNRIIHSPFSNDLVGFERMAKSTGGTASSTLSRACGFLHMGMSIQLCARGSHLSFCGLSFCVHLEADCCLKHSPFLPEFLSDGCHHAIRTNLTTCFIVVLGAACSEIYTRCIFLGCPAMTRTHC